MKLFKKAKRGFTLVELVVVIAVIAILAAVSVGAYFGVTESANKSKLEQESRQFYTAIQTTALVPSDNYTLNADGLTVKDIDQFEAALEYTMGQDIEVLNTEPIYIAKQTIVLKTTDFYAQNGGTLYKTFEYYTPEVSGKKIAVNVVNGEYYHYNTNVVVNNNGVDVTNDTIFFKAPKMQDKVYIHVFAGKDDTYVCNKEYPGEEMRTYVSALDLYAYNVPSNYETVVFTWYQYKTENGNVVLDNNGLPIEEKKGQTQNIALSERTSTKNYFIHDGNTWQDTPIVKDAQTEGKTVYVKPGTSDEKMYAYAFNFNSEKNATWPGVEMTIDEMRLDRLASYTFDKDYCVVIFHNNNGTQTENLFLTDAGEFAEEMYYDLTEKTWSTTLPVDTFVAPTSVGLMGSNSNWYTDLEFEPDQYGKIWTLTTILMENDEFKIRCDNNWNNNTDINYSKLSDDLKEMFSVKDKDNILVKESAYYTFTYDAVKRVLSAVKGDPYDGEAPFIGPNSVELIGNFNDTDWDAPVYFDTEDKKTWNLEIDLVTGDEFKIRVNKNWNKDGKQYEFGYQDLNDEVKSLFAHNDTNIKVMADGTYSFTFDFEQEDISCTTTAEIEQPVENKLYLKPNSNWTKDNARFAAYFFGNGETWVDATLVEGEKDIYEVTVPADYPNIIFCRMNPSASANNWSNKWNQTGDLSIPTDDQVLFTVPDGSWDKATTGWSVKE